MPFAAGRPRRRRSKTAWRTFSDFDAVSRFRHVIMESWSAAVPAAPAAGPSTETRGRSNAR
jgi:hypothetical protein